VAHIVRPSTWTKHPEVLEYLEAYLADCSPRPDHSILVDELAGTGEAAILTRFHVWVPSHSRHELGIAYGIRVLFHRARPGAPLGYVTAVHDGRGCEAHDAGKRCKHLDAALAAVIRDYRGFLPNHGRISEPASHVKVVPDLEPERSRSTGTDPWGLD
jgi:hypothetical protein